MEGERLDKEEKRWDWERWVVGGGLGSDVEAAAIKSEK